jgi:hypothetical protein
MSLPSQRVGVCEDKALKVTKTSYSVLWFPESWTPTRTAPEGNQPIVNEVFPTAQEAQRVVSGGSSIVLAHQRTSHPLIGKLGSVP